MRVSQELSSWGNKLDLAAVAYHPSPFWLGEVLALNFIVVDTVVISTQRCEIRWIRLTTMLMCTDVVDLAAVGWYFAVRPRADEVLGHS